MEDKYISLELAKKLKEVKCKVKFERCWGKYLKPEINIGGYKIGEVTLFYETKLRSEMTERWEMYPAYDIMWDIAIVHAKEFFGEGYIDCYGVGEQQTAWHYHSIRILELMQQGKKKECEAYIWDNCLFSKEQPS